MLYKGFTYIYIYIRKIEELPYIHTNPALNGPSALGYWNKIKEIIELHRQNH